MFDVEKIRSSVHISEIIGKEIQLTRQGREFKCLCPFHADSDPSLTINDDKEFAHCFACGWHGDVVDFVMEYHKVDFKSACAILGGEKEAPKTTLTKREKKPPVDYYADLEAVAPPEDAFIDAGKPVRLWNHKQQRYSTMTPSMVFPYHDADGALLGYVLRIDIDGGKITPTVRMMSRQDGQAETRAVDWTICPFTEPRPLYGLDRLAMKPDAQVFVCEGEKAADAAYRILGVPAITWAGGANGVKHADWLPLKGRRVVVWGDADEVGEKAAREVADRALQAGAESVRLIDWDVTREKGWDAADAEQEGMDKTAVVAWAKPRLREVKDDKRGNSERSDDDIESGRHAGGKSVDEAGGREGTEGGGKDDNRPCDLRERGVEERDSCSNSEASVESDSQALPVETPIEETNESDVPYYGERINDVDDRGEPDRDDQPFRFLGFKGDTCYYMPKDSCQVLPLTPPSHTTSNLLFLAPMDYWERTYPAKGKKFDVDCAMNAMIQYTKRVGFFDETSIRGRGAWIDDKRAVVNLGTRIYCDGNFMRVADFKSRHTYEASLPININMANPTTSKEAQKLVDICSRVSWEKKLSADLLVGWCVIAPVCGALKWRPHIWVTGSSGSGKSTVRDNIVKPVVGEISLNCDGNSSEAYIRQSINKDARPVIMDETEGEEKTDAEMLQKVLRLARVSSSGGEIGKGSGDGTAKTYSVRSCFYFSSINTSCYHHADETRISRLVLKGGENKSDEEYIQLMADINEWFTPEFTEGLFARTVANLTTLLDNAKTFSDAAAAVMKSRRAADQIGTLLAGRYLCNSTKRISFADAVAWIEERKDNLLEYTSISSTKDETKLLTRLMAHRVRVQGDEAMHDLTIGELVLGLDDGELPFDVTKKSAEAELKRNGFKVGRRKEDDEICLFVANGAPAVEKILKDTAWARADISRPLRSLAGAMPTGAIYYNAGLTAKGTSIPLSLIKPQQEGEEK